MSQWNATRWNTRLWGGSSGSNGSGGTTAERLIYDAYRALGVLRPGQGTSPDGMDDAFRLLNDMVEAWNLEHLMIHAETRSMHPLTAGVSCYTIGPTGSLPGERPLRLTAASVVVSNGCSCAALPAGDGCGQGIYYEPTYPDGTIIIKPAPSGGSLAIASWQELTGFADLTTPYGFPPGYALALRWNLTWELAPYALIMRKIPQVLLDNIQERAISAKAAIKSFNSSPPPTMDATDGGMLACCGGGAYDICSDNYGQVSAVPPLVISGPPGIAGPSGPPGPQGQGIRILPPVATQADLPAAAAPGDVVITNDTGELWGWD